MSAHRKIQGQHGQSFVATLEGGLTVEVEGSGRLPTLLKARVIAVTLSMPVKDLIEA